MTVLSGVMIAIMLVVALLAIPISLSFQLTWRRHVQGNIRLGWLFGLVRIPITLPSPSTTPSAVSEPKPPSSPRKHGKKNLTRMFGDKSLRRRIIQFIGDVWRAIRKENLFLHLRIGLGDPADTGRLWGGIGPLAAMLACYQDAEVEFEPDFYEETFELDSHGDIRLIPLQLIYLIVGLLLSQPMLKNMKIMRQSK